ncbi:LysR family transcriptional regulator [Agaribacterium haliotis]|uniref:LysR family transcriptional regulator n=1 Tax=Agaribacterium haliotis TaxID=2013869 RepID=UPI000BB58C2A|nr:LysR family transcriptional regulator [Agaribacterium haliotis]
MLQDLNDMMVFLAVVESASFTRAADKLGMPKANVSRKVSKLERELGVVLLERSTRSQHLTEAGRKYLAHCKRIQEELSLAEVSLEQLTHQIKGPLKIGASVGVGQQLLSPVLPEFLAAYPELQLELKLINERVDLIEGGYDLLIRVGQLDDSRLLAKRLGTIQRSLFASPTWLSSNAKLVKLEELCGCDFLYMSRMSEGRELRLHKAKSERRLKIQPRMHVDDFSVIKHAALSGLGIAVLPDYMATEALARGELQRVFVDWRLEPIELYALYPKNRLKIPKVQRFVEHISQSIGSRLA